MKALALALCIALNLHSIEIPFQGNQIFQLDEHQTTLKTDFKAFRNWMLAKKPPTQKEVLIRNTVLDVHYPLTPTVNWAKAKMSNESFDTLIINPLENISLVVTSVAYPYNYSPNYAFWIDFANANTFGGGFRGKGNVQEERMFMEFPQLPQLGYAKRNNQILPVTKNCTTPRESPSCAEPFLVFDILRRFDVNKVPYGKALYQANPKSIPNDIQKLSKPYPIVNIIGLAANDRCAKGLKDKPYSLLDLKYLLKEALLGNLGALKFNLQQQRGNPEVHTGPWGTGAFKNSEAMITAIQILAGAMSQMTNEGIVHGIHLFFHVIPARLVAQIQNDVIIRLKQNQTPLDLLHYFLNLQESDPSIWGPKTCKD